MIKKASSKTYDIFSIVLLISFISCKSNQEHNIPVSFGPKVVEAHGYVVPKESIAIPKVIPAGKPKVVLAGKPKVIFTSTNVHLAGIPKIVKAGIPRVSTPGQDSFSILKTAPAIDSPYLAGIPEVVMAKEAYSKDQNPENISSFGKLQGLKSSVIYCMVQDKNGNIWFGTQGEGVNKYDGKSFTQFSEKEGLSKFVRSILLDKKGNIWFGTWVQGVIKYDGKYFTRYTVKEGMVSNYVLSILEDKNGNLWFGTAEGVSKYDGKNFTRFTEKEGLSNNWVNSILQDKNGHLWFGTAKGVCKYDGKSFTHFTEKEGLINNGVLSILEDKRGNLWFGTAEGVSKYDGKSFIRFTEKEGLSNNIVNSILEDRNGHLWFGTKEGGVSKYDRKSFIHFTEKEGLSKNEIWSILQDKSGNLWFGTAGGGVSKYVGKQFTHFTDKDGLTNKEIWSILHDRNGNLWFGTRKGGVNKYNGKSFTQFTEKEGLIHNNVWSILEDKRGNLWFGTYQGVCKYNGKSFTYFTEKEGLIHNNVWSILEDRTGNLWFGTANGLSKFTGKEFIQFTTKEGLGVDNVMNMLEDNNGDLWFCGYNGGVSKYDGKDGFTHFTMKAGLSHNDVRCMQKDESGNMWFGTLGGGLNKYDCISITHYTKKEGLSDNNIRSLLKDKNGNIWSGTTFGLNKLPKDKLTSFIMPFNLSGSKPIFKPYTNEDGFSGNGVNAGNTIYEARDGTIWIGSDDRLTAFHPDAETQDTIAPNIQLTGLTLFNENIEWQILEKKMDTGSVAIILSNGAKVHDVHFDGVSKWYGLPEHLSLAYNNNYLTFQFVGITLQSPKKVKYQYKLEGLEESWSALTNRSEATYGPLPPNQYTFKVKAMNGEGYWSNELGYSFSIRPPWWSTWWFKVLSSVFILGTIALFLYIWLQYKFKQKLKVELIRQKIAADLHDELGSNLSSMAFSVELMKKKLNGPREDIEHLLNKLVSNSKETTSLISDTIWSLNPKNDSFDKWIERIKNFTQEILSSKEIEYTFDSNNQGPSPMPSLEQKRNIYLIYKEAINNIAKHSKASRVHIMIESLHDKLIIEITDNGIGFDTLITHQGNGLNNFKSRSDKESCEVLYSSIIGKGTSVKITAYYNLLKQKNENWILKN